MLFGVMLLVLCVFTATATPEIYTYVHPLSLHDALPICCCRSTRGSSREEPAAARSSHSRPGRRRAGAGIPGAADPGGGARVVQQGELHPPAAARDRKSTRLNSSH